MSCDSYYESPPRIVNSPAPIPRIKLDYSTLNQGILTMSQILSYYLQNKIHTSLIQNITGNKENHSPFEEKESEPQFPNILVFDMGAPPKELIQIDYSDEINLDRLQMVKNVIQKDEDRLKGKYVLKTVFSEVQVESKPQHRVFCNLDSKDISLHGRVIKGSGWYCFDKENFKKGALNVGEFDGMKK